MSIFKMNPLSNKNLLFGLGIGVILQMFAIYLTFLQPYLKTMSLGIEDWIIILAVSSTIVIATEVYKYIEKQR